MPVDLWPFQQECVDKLGTPALASRLIGDEMGLGKTLEGIAIDYRLRVETPRVGTKRRRTLVLAPKGVHDHWQEHIKLYWPTAKVYVYDHGLQPLAARYAFVQALSRPYSYYVIHYEAIRSNDLLIHLRSVRWFNIIADECQRIKNHKAQQTRALKSLRTRYKCPMSGTPADDKPQDLWSALNWMWPRRWTSYWRYVRNYCEVQDKDPETGDPLYGKGGNAYKKIIGVNEAAVPELLLEMRPYYIRRLKEQVMPELPEKYYTRRFVDLPSKQRKAYNEMRDDMIAWVGEHEDQPLSAPVVIAQLMRLQQFALASAEITYVPVITHRERAKAKEHGRKPVPEMVRRVLLMDPSAKLDSMEELIEDNSTEQFVFFSQFRTMVDLAATRLAANKITCGIYTGAITDQQERDRTREAFQRGDIQVFAGTIATGGEGISLTAASTVGFFDRHWNPAKNRQAEDRLHRPGQKNAVQVIDFIARNTVDLGRNAQIASKWTTIKLLLGDTIDLDAYEAALRKEAA
jgi:SNF2 family DNA or RNA helicase